MLLLLDMDWKIVNVSYACQNLKWLQNPLKFQMIPSAPHSKIEAKAWKKPAFGKIMQFFNGKPVSNMPRRGLRIMWKPLPI